MKSLVLSRIIHRTDVNIVYITKMLYICIGQPYMNWNKLRLTVIGVILLTMSACIRDRIPEGADLRPGDRLPWFSVTMDDGSVLSTGDLAGKVSVIVFFHTGCPDCQAELPVIQRIHDEFSPEPGRRCRRHSGILGGKRTHAPVFSTKRPYGVQSFRIRRSPSRVCIVRRPDHSQHIR